MQCSNGFYLENGKCLRCSSSCLTCDPSKKSKCLSCYPNNFLIGETCLSCSKSCLTCISSDQPDKCTSCKDGYYLDKNTCIKGCPNNCLNCESGTLCTQCILGYTILSKNNEKKCIPCTTSCRTCA